MSLCFVSACPQGLVRRCRVEISYWQRQCVFVSSRWSQTPSLPCALPVPWCPWWACHQRGAVWLESGSRVGLNKVWWGGSPYPQLYRSRAGAAQSGSGRGLLWLFVSPPRPGGINQPRPFFNYFVHARTQAYECNCSAWREPYLCGAPLQASSALKWLTCGKEFIFHFCLCLCVGACIY